MKREPWQTSKKSTSMESQQNDMQYLVYIVRCADGTLYTGIATDVEKRIDQHNGFTKGGAKYTKARGPVELVYTETSASRSEALVREYQIKKLTRPEKERLITSQKRGLRAGR